MNKPLWTPSPQRINEANLTKFITYLSDTFHTSFDNYQALHQWSINNKDAFWSSIVLFFNVRGSFDFDNALTSGEHLYDSEWFKGSTLNYAENLLAKSNDDIAVIERAEDGRRSEISYRQLTNEVERIAGAMRELGVQKGDRVAAFLPNCTEAIVGMLAAASIGAVWSSCSPDFGLTGVIDRFGQIEPKLLLATNGYNYAGKKISSLDRVAAIASELSSIKQVVIINYISEDNANAPDLQSVLWEDFTSKTATPLTFEPLSFSDPLYIMYSSGTTGIPKCIVHGIGGTLLQHTKELALHTDVTPDDCVFYYTTCGWMMWNWMVSSLSLGAKLVIFDGSPFQPSPNTLFQIADEEGISVFGASAKYYAACEKEGLTPKDNNLTRLKSILSTGSPLSHESFDYIYTQIKEDICLSSISGGTDIVSCFALGNPILPVYRGELQCIGLGMDVAFYDESGNDLEEGKGELVCRSAFPSMPIGFWNDASKAKYKKAYFESYDYVWAHGDYGEFVRHVDENSIKTDPSQIGVIIHGRSDAVLNPGGVRIGTAEIYRQVEKIDAVLESIAIGQSWKDDIRIVLFVKMKQPNSLDEATKIEIRQVIRSNTTPRHVPSKIIEVLDIPRTISGKIVELAVRNIVHGVEVKNKDALANPEALDYFKGLTELNA